MSASPRLRHGGGLARWAVHHPVGVVMITLAASVLGAFALGRLAVDLLPRIIYPEVGIRVLDPGVPAQVMEDRITRQLEEQLAITEDVISITSRTTEGRSAVELSFPYGKDIDVAVRDASTRLDRARRFLPDTIQPPIVFKRDPSQRPILELVVSSATRDPVSLRSWVDDIFAKWFLNLPGVAAAEVGGGVVREIHVLPDQRRLAALGVSPDALAELLDRANRDEPAGRLRMQRQELGGRTAGRFTSVDELRQLPVPLADGGSVRLGEVAEVLDSHEDEKLRIRYNDVPGIKVSIQKQPNANTVAVANVVAERLEWMRAQRLLPDGVRVDVVGDQSVYVRQALRNAATAALSGALLAMGVVYLFLGNLRRTLIIGSAIPIAVLVTFFVMDAGGLTLNVMTLGGLAVGIGLLVDNTVVMLENIYRHQRDGEHYTEAGVNAANEVNSAIVASTSTNLAAVLPFLFIGGLTGLLFRELIFTVSAAIFASMVVALTLTPALGARVPATGQGRVRRVIDGVMRALQDAYARLVGGLLARRWAQALVLLGFGTALALAVPTLAGGKQIFLPDLDNGEVRVRLTGDPGISLEAMDRHVRRIEAQFRADPAVVGVFTLSGGFVFGRSQYEASNRATLTVQLLPRGQREFSSDDWVRRNKQALDKRAVPGLNVRISTLGTPGIRVGSGDDDLGVRIQGDDLETLAQLADRLAEELRGIDGLRSITYSSEEQRQELAITVDRDRAAALGLDVARIGLALRLAVEGDIVTEYLDGDRAFDVRLRLPRSELADPRDLESVLLFTGSGDRPPVYLGDVARVSLVAAPAEIQRDAQRRIVEVSANVAGDADLAAILRQVQQKMEALPLPDGYSVYEAGAGKALQEGRALGGVLLALAIFLVFAVMAVQYESLLNPLVILLGVPFAVTGVAIGLQLTALPLSMPVWLGLIMLSGIVVNNAIVLVEYIELRRAAGLPAQQAIVEAARLRLRPILMTTLTTVAGMLPLSLGVGDGAEMLRPLAVAIVSGLSFSLLVSLLLIPLIYRWLAGHERPLPQTGNAVAA
ncbi:MAG TPA: efflux RND transporter permease subunit [Gammaproteobacteria bacterium]